MSNLKEVANIKKRHWELKNQDANKIRATRTRRKEINITIVTKSKEILKTKVKVEKKCGIYFHNQDGGLVVERKRALLVRRPGKI